MQLAFHQGQDVHRTISLVSDPSLDGIAIQTWVCPRQATVRILLCSRVCLRSCKLSACHRSPGLRVCRAAGHPAHAERRTFIYLFIISHESSTTSSDPGCRAAGAGARGCRLSFSFCRIASKIRPVLCSESACPAKCSNSVTAAFCRREACLSFCSLRLA